MPAIHGPIVVSEGVVAIVAGAGEGLLVGYAAMCGICIVLGNETMKEVAVEHLDNMAKGLERLVKRFVNDG